MTAVTFAVFAKTAVMPANARWPDDPATVILQQTQLLNEHAARFLPTTTPAAVDAVRYGKLTMRQLVATVDVPALTRVATYPIELVSDTHAEFDDTYAVLVYREVTTGGLQQQQPPRREPLSGFSGIPTSRSLTRDYVDGLPTLAMFANEPDTSQFANCRFIFPTVVQGREPRVGDVCCGYLVTLTAVRQGEALTWCYSPPSDERAYTTSCAAAQ